MCWGGEVGRGDGNGLDEGRERAFFFFSFFFLRKCLQDLITRFRNLSNILQSANACKITQNLVCITLSDKNEETIFLTVQTCHPYREFHLKASDVFNASSEHLGSLEKLVNPS